MIEAACERQGRRHLSQTLEHAWHARNSSNERFCQSTSQVASGLPSLTGLTGPRIDFDRIFLRRSDWVSSTQTPHATRKGISTVATALCYILLVEKKLCYIPRYVGRDDGNKGIFKATSPRVHQLPDQARFNK